MITCVVPSSFFILIYISFHFIRLPFTNFFKYIFIGVEFDYSLLCMENAVLTRFGFKSAKLVEPLNLIANSNSSLNN